MVRLISRNTKSIDIRLFILNKKVIEAKPPKYEYSDSKHDIKKKKLLQN